MWVRELEWIDPVAAASRLAGFGRLAFLDSAMTHATLGRFSYVAVDPFGIFRVRAGRAFWNDIPEPTPPIPALRRRLARYGVERHPDLPPFQGGAIGFFGYEFGWSLEGRAPPIADDGHEAYLAFYDVVAAFDHVTRRCWLIASGWPADTQAGRGERAQARLATFGDRLAESIRVPPPASPEVAWTPTVSPAGYRDGVERVKAYIRAGDIYQANIAQRFTAEAPRNLDAWSLYRRVRETNPAPFSAFLDCDAQKILSTSPELFLRSDGRHVETRPIKGTARRAAAPGEDREVADRLLASRKDRAENVMIVDLLRNDLSRVCAPASVEVPMLCGLETYAGLHHLVSAVTGALRDEYDTLDLLAASFPGGSITGAPKLRAMEIIGEIERHPRGIYCGAIGALGFDGSIDLNIAIRTVTIEAGELSLCAGGGITMLSDAEAEYEETLTKAHRIFQAFAPKRAMAGADA